MTIDVRNTPRSPAQARDVYYLVPKGTAKRLKYPPQHADIETTTIKEAVLVADVLKRAGTKYWIYDWSGKRQKGIHDKTPFEQQGFGHVCTPDMETNY